MYIRNLQQISFFFTFCFGHATQLIGSQFPNQGWKLHPLHWKGRVLTTGLPWKSTLFIKKKKQEHFLGNSLAAQWLGLCTFTRRDPGSILGWGTKILQAMPGDQKKKKNHHNLPNMFLNSKMLETFPLKSKTRKRYLISLLLLNIVLKVSVNAIRKLKMKQKC